MDAEELQNWRDGVGEFCHHLSLLRNDKEIIIKSIEAHLSQFFEWDNIEYAHDFSKITLSYKHDHGAVVDPDKMCSLGIPWIVSPHYDDKAFKIIRIELYPFGLPEEGVIYYEE